MWIGTIQTKGRVMVLEKLKSYAENLPENLSPKFEFRMSAAGDCVRKLDYDYQVGSRSIDSKSFFRMSLGHASHSFLRELVSGAFGEDFYHAENEIKVALPSGQVVKGHPDGRILSLKATLEIKSVSDSTFTMIKNDNKPIDAHETQTNTYAAAQGDENCVILYANRDSGEMYEFMFPASEQLYQHALLKFKTVEKNKAEGKISPRPYSNAQESPCWFCPWVKQCYEGFDREVGAFKAEVFDSVRNPVLVDHAIRAVKYRTDRLVATKLEDTLKEIVGKILHSSQIKEAEIIHEKGIIDATITVGKNNNLLTSLKERKVKQ